jgi:hypothetical protein
LLSLALVHVTFQLLFFSLFSVDALWDAEFFCIMKSYLLANMQLILRTDVSEIHIASPHPIPLFHN